VAAAGTEALFVDTNGRVGMGNTAPTAKLDITGNLNVSSYATAGASLAVGYTNAPAGPGNAIFSGNVGIGTTNPSYQLHTTGNVALSTTSGGVSIGSIVPSSTYRLQIGNTYAFQVYPDLTSIVGEIPANTAFMQTANGGNMVFAAGTLAKTQIAYVVNSTNWTSALEISNTFSRNIKSFINEIWAWQRRYRHYCPYCNT